jgi:hypothetical protein
MSEQTGCLRGRSTQVALWAVAVAVALVSPARATDFNEVEPNQTKASADTNGTIVLAPGDTINGLTTSSSTTGASPANVDMFHVKTGPLPLGIYLHRLTITTTGTTGHTGTIRALTQTAGVINTGTDTTLQSSSTVTTPPRSNAWYGFGKEEELYWRIAGTTSTTANYVSTFSTEGPIAPTTIGPFTEGQITITTELLAGTNNTEILVFDSNLDPVPGFMNDDTFMGANTRSTLTRTFTPGTYYVAVSTQDAATNEASPADDDDRDQPVLDFAGAFVRESTATVVVDLDFSITDVNGTQTFSNQLPTNFSYQIAWYTFTVEAPSIPANNDCANANPITGGQTLPGTTFLATNDGSATCDPGGGASRDIWYSFSTNHNGTLSLDTCGSSVDTALALYSGSCGSLTELACSDDCGGSPCGGTDSCVSLAIAPGSYQIRVSDKGIGANGGTISLHADFVPDSDDPCSAAVVTSVPYTDSVNNSQSAPGPDVSCNGTTAETRFPIWYTYTPAGNCALQIRETSTQAVDITVFTGPDCNTLTEAACTTAESTVFAAQGGVQYWIQIHLTTATPPSVPLMVEINCVTPPANDTPCGATVINALPFGESVDNSSATPDFDVSCNTASATGVPHGVWYTYSPGSDCSIELDENSTQSAVWAVFSGSDCNGLSPYFCSPNDQNDHVDLFAGTQYWILVGIDSANAAIPTVSVSVGFDCVVPPAGEACPTAVEITTPFSTTIDTDLATANMPGAPCDSNFGTTQNDAWFKYVATDNCVMIISATFGASDGLFSVWQGTSCSNKILVTCHDDSTGTTSPSSRESGQFPVTAGQTYWIQVGDNGSTEDGGPVDVVVTCTPAPANDEACGATVIGALPFGESIDISTAAADVWMSDPVADGTNLCGTTTASDTPFGVWYTYTPATNCTLIIEETSTENNVLIGAFVGACNSLFQADCTGSAFEAMSIGLTAGNQYWFLIGIYDASPPAPVPTAPLVINFDCRPAPANDLVCNATSLNVTGVPFNEQVDVAAATHDVDMSGSCNATGGSMSSNGVWYTYTPAATCTALISEGSSQNAAIAVYSGFDCNSLNELTCTGNEAVTAGMTAGQQYWILVALGTANPGLGDTTTPMDITIDCADPPANDLPCGATVIGSTPYSVSQSIALATNDVDIACNSTTGTQETQKGVWWQYTPASDCMAQISESSSSSVAIAVFTGPDCNSLSETACTNAEHFGFPMSAGQTYWILIGLETNTPTVPSAQLAMTFNCVSSDPPANDEPCGATLINALPFTDNPVNAAANPEFDVSCNATAATSTPFGIWYKYTPATTCALLMSETSAQSIVWAVFTDADCSGIGPEDQLLCSSTETNVQFNVLAGTAYWILVGSDAAAPTTPGIPLSISIDCPATMPNEVCSAATEITALPFSLDYNNFIQGASPPAGSCNEFGQDEEMLHDVWFKWTAPQNCSVTLTIQGPPSPSDPMCAVYTGTECGTCTATGCSGLIEVDCINRAAGFDGPIDLVFNATAGVTYWFQAGDSGTILQGGPTNFTLEGPCGPVGCTTCRGDLTGDSTLDGRDVKKFTECVISAAGGPAPATCECADVVIDSVVDMQDVTEFVNRLLAPPPCP